MSPGGTDVSLLELVLGFVVAVVLITVITMILRRRGGSRDLLGSQVRELRARAAAASPSADTRQWDAATRIADARRHEAAARAPAADDVPSDPPTAAASAADTASPATADRPAADRPTQDPTAPLYGRSPTPDAMVDAFAWLRIAALVEAGHREQAVDLLSTTMAISTDEAQLLVDGLADAGGERRPD
ncbi:hypothetical protein [Micromonospora sp. RL09-050-HVF-A]|uniref:hypothetical protein n=1 Tax=Micromonospora sp. RL09-050-HVF-A TaxID=1703433 RepID=UPI001C5FBFA3|nr:hypothetical protein [Micromonospora sp. RL09-050-HVF-A]MBW4700459.1 hypothetical protein [Micromonospora sp. RL09-050-HVF-A]